LAKKEKTDINYDGILTKWFGTDKKYFLAQNGHAAADDAAKTQIETRWTNERETPF
jgi:hypothetical protein